jgi:hypothetical protein
MLFGHSETKSEQLHSENILLRSNLNCGVKKRKNNIDFITIFFHFLKLRIVKVVQKKLLLIEVLKEKNGFTHYYDVPQECKTFFSDKKPIYFP